ncbi:hypothetical protein NDK43_00005, partial [Neobacillus pocheonensis]|nr:hypothetical protein [Neobacillus pocheonensis]
MHTTNQGNKNHQGINLSDYIGTNSEFNRTDLAVFSVKKDGLHLIDHWNFPQGSSTKNKKRLFHITESIIREYVECMMVVMVDSFELLSEN